MAAAQAGLEQDTLARRQGLGPIKRGVSGTTHPHAVARDDPLRARHVGVGHAKQVDEGAHGQGQLVFFTRNGRQVHRGNDAGIVTGGHGQTASACGQAAHGQCITVGDAGQSAAADQVAGQHEARRHALLWTRSTGSAACRNGIGFCRCGQHSGHFVLDVRKDLGLIAGLDGDGPSRLDIGVVQVGLDHGRGFVADLAAHQGIDGREQHVLCFPTDGVECQGDTHRGAIGADRAVVAGVDAGGVAALDAHITFGGGDLAVGNVGGRLVEDQVGGNRTAHGQALAFSTSGFGRSFQACIDAGRLGHGHTDRTRVERGIADERLGQSTHVVAHHQTTHRHSAFDRLSGHFCGRLGRGLFVHWGQGKAQGRGRNTIGRDAKRDLPLAFSGARFDGDGQVSRLQALTIFGLGRQQARAQLSGAGGHGQVLHHIVHAIEFHLQVEVGGACGGLQIDVEAGALASLALAFCVGLHDQRFVSGGDHRQGAQVFACQSTTKLEGVLVIGAELDSDRACCAQSQVQGVGHGFGIGTESDGRGGESFARFVQRQGECARAVALDVDPLALVQAHRRCGLFGEVERRLFGHHAQVWHSLAAQLPDQLDQVTVACSGVTRVASDLNVRLHHLQAQARLGCIQDTHVLRFEVGDGSGRIFGPVEMEGGDRQAVRARNEQTEALLAKLLLEGDAVGLVLGDGAAVLQGTDFGLRLGLGGHAGDGAQLIDVGLGITALHGQQVIAIFGHRDLDLPLAKGLVQCGLDECCLVCRGEATLTLLAGLGTESQGVAGHALADGLHPFGRDLGNIFAGLAATESDVESANAAGRLFECDLGIGFGLADRDLEQARDSSLQDPFVVVRVVGEGQLSRALIAQYEHVFFVDVLIGVEEADALNLLGLLAQTQDFDVVGDLGFAQGKIEVRCGATVGGCQFEFEGLQLRHTNDGGFELIGVGPLELDVGLCTDLFISCRGRPVFRFWGGCLV